MDKNDDVVGIVLLSKRQWFRVLLMIDVTVPCHQQQQS